EDGIRDPLVTGVQTCALPICSAPDNQDTGSYKVVRLQRLDVSPAYYLWRLKDVLPEPLLASLIVVGILLYPLLVVGELLVRTFRSEERRVWEEGRSPWEAWDD